MLCAMYLFISHILVNHIRLKNLLDIEIDTLAETEPLHHKTLYAFSERNKGCLSHKTFHFFIVTETYQHKLCECKRCENMNYACNN